MVMTTRQTLARAGTGGAAAAVMALVLAGCVNYAGIKSEKQISSPAQYESSQSLPDEGGQWPSLDWPSQFGYPQLPRLINESLQGNPSIAQARARIEKAASYIDSSKSALYPKATDSYSLFRKPCSGTAISPPPYRCSWYSKHKA